MKHVRRARGFSLLELMVSCAILGLLMSLVAMILSPTMRTVKQAETDTETQQQAVQALEKLFQETAYSDYRSATFSSDGTAYAFQSTRTPSVAGQPTLGPIDYIPVGIYSDPIEWQEVELVRFDPITSRVLRRELPCVTNQLLQVPPSRFPALWSSAVYHDTVIASNIYDFQVMAPDRDRLRVLVTCQKQGQKGLVQTQIEMQTAWRN